MSHFLRRWSDRKSESRHVQTDGTAAPDAQGPDAQGPAASGPDSPPLPADEADIAARLAALPSLDEIGAGTDIRPFLQSFVPLTLRNAAMRRAWASDPVISTHLDVARDYACDFNAIDLPVGFARTLGQDAVQRSVETLKSSSDCSPPPPAAEVPGDMPDPGMTAEDAAPSDPSANGADPAPPATAATQKAAPDQTGQTTAELPEETSRPGLRIRRKHGGALPG